MDSYLANELLKALGEGNLTKFLAYGAIFMFLWVEVRGLKQEMVTLNKNISENFAGAEVRFVKVENKQMSFEHRLTVLEEIKGRNNEVSSI